MKIFHDGCGCMSRGEAASAKNRSFGLLGAAVAAKLMVMLRFVMRSLLLLTFCFWRCRFCLG